jgi:hypothetical protein
MTNDQAPMTNGEEQHVFIGHWDLVIGHSPTNKLTINKKGSKCQSLSTSA